jgi:phage shock protein A
LIQTSSKANHFEAESYQLQKYVKELENELQYLRQSAANANTKKYQLRYSEPTALRPRSGRKHSSLWKARCSF